MISGLGAGPLAPASDTTAFLIPLLAPTTSSSLGLSLPQTCVSLLTLRVLGAGTVPENFTSPTMEPAPWAVTWVEPDHTRAAATRITSGGMTYGLAEPGSSRRR